MKVLAITAACLLSATFSFGECMEVTGANSRLPAFQSSSRRVSITAVQEGKALGNVRVLFYLSTDEVNPKLALTTDKQGVVLAPDLAPGRYRILAFGPEQESAEAYLEVSEKGGTQANSFLMAIPPTFSKSAQAVKRRICGLNCALDFAEHSDSCERISSSSRCQNAKTSRRF